jgi:putative long chain acyl-CoA synthase
MAEETAERSSSRGGSFAGRFIAAVQNGLEIARFGGLGEREPSPYEVVVEDDNHKLRRYFPERDPRGRPPALLVPPLMLSAEIWDVAPESSAVASLLAGGADPWVVDFGSPEQEAGGLERTLTDHVVAVDRAVSAVRKATGRDVHLMGYSQGGMFAYQAAAFRQSEGVASLVTFGSPVDLHRGLPPYLPIEFITDAIERLGKLQASMMPDGIPSWATRLGFQLMDPVKTVRQRIDFALQLYDRDALQQREGMRRFLESEGWVAFPGPALRDVMDQLVAHNRLLQGGVVIDERPVTLADITCPILAFVGETDSIAPAPTVRAIRNAAPRAEAWEIKIPAGHFGLVVGSRSDEITWPSVSEWLEWCDERGPLPERATVLEAPSDREAESPSTLDEIVSGAELAFDLGRGLLGDAAHLLNERVDVLGRIWSRIVPQISQLTRLVELRRETQTSMGHVLQERADQSPEDTFFLFENRAYSYEAANVRIDNVVRGFLSCGVRQGDHVGVLMETRPSAVAATVALSRLGAVAVLLRPDLPLAEQLAVAPADHVVADPEHGVEVREAFGKDVLVLGGGGDPRRLPEGLVDMEAIDPDLVTVPDWYRPNPGKAGELSFILINGESGHVGINRVTNRRWATSAYGTASACALTSADTVYCCSPTHHATGIMVCVAGALVSGARLAMATHFEPKVFWEDVRRYGVNVVFYTGTLCRALVNSPDSPAERHHPLRLFAGSGMPKATWERVVERFSPARVVEFFASTEGNAVLVNLTGEKIGSVGRPLPGAADLAVAAWDMEKGDLVQDPSGFARRCRRGDIGLLLAEIDVGRGEVEGRPLRGVFEAGDAWLATGDLVRRDADGDYWLIDRIADVIHGRVGAIPTIPIEDLLACELPGADLAAVYGVASPKLEAEIPVAAITLRPGQSLDPTALRQVVGRLPGPHRPAVVRIVDELPTTAGHRIRKGPLRREGLEAKQGETLWLAPGETAYLPYSPADEDALIASLDRR